MASGQETANAKQSDDRVRRNHWKGIAAFLLLVNVGTAAVLCVAFRSAPSEHHRDAVSDIRKRGESPQLCATNRAVFPQKQDRLDVLDPMSSQELLRVRDFLLSQRELQLTPYVNATPAANYIYLVQLYVPPKDDVLRSLNGTSRQPAERRALVTVFRGADQPPRVQTLLVGPFDERKLTYQEVPDSNAVLEFTRRPWSLLEYFGITKLLQREMDDRVLAIFEASFDARPIWSDCKPKCFQWILSPTYGDDQERRIMWLSTSRQQEAEYLFPMDLYAEVDITSSDPSEYRLLRIFYGGRMYSSPAELVDTVERDPAARAKHIPWTKNEMFSTMRRRVDHPSARSRNTQREPKQFSPDGHRFTVTGNRVSYLDWHFRFLLTPTTGMKLFDVRFRDQRIAYEISLQEMAATYSGFNPVLAETDFLDGGYLPGTASFELFPGVDCPDNAVMLDAYHMADSGEVLHIRNAICIFEHNLGIPLRRHFSFNFFEGGPFRSYGGQSDVALVVRTISLAYNYNYVIDYIFHLNGALESRVASTGYVWSAYDRPQERPYGSPLHDGLNGPLHTHWFHFKLDLDILGRSNTFETIDFQLERGGAGRKHLWRNATRPEVVFHRRPCATERDAVLTHSLDKPKFWLMTNPTHRTHAGTPRGYRLLSSSFAKWLMPESAENNDAFSWIRQHLAVTRYKREEEHSSNMFLSNGQRRPTMVFSDMYADDEAIEKEDLVMWLTLGLYHLPHTEDLPVTDTAAARVMFMLQPFNYFDEDPSMVENNLVFVERDLVTGRNNLTRYTSTETCTPVFEHPPYDGRIV